MVDDMKRGIAQHEPRCVLLTDACQALVTVIYELYVHQALSRADQEILWQRNDWDSICSRRFIDSKDITKVNDSDTSTPMKEETKERRASFKPKS